MDRGYLSEPFLITDYQFKELGDEPGTQAPIRLVKLISYDGDKYATVNVFQTIHSRGFLAEIKAGYIYQVVTGDFWPPRIIQVPETILLRKLKK